MLVGIKPTVGLVSRRGIIPISHSQDTAGPLARSVADAAAVLAAIRGIDPGDPVTGCSAPHQSDLTSRIGEGLPGLRIGVPRGGFWEPLSEAEAAETERVIAVLRDCGATVVDPARLVETAFDLSLEVLLHEFKSGLNHYLAALAPEIPVHTLGELVRYNRDRRKKALRYGQTILTKSERFTSGTLTEPIYIQARSEDIRRCRTEGIDAALDGDRLDLLLFPAYYGCAVAARAGYPSIAIPSGLVESDRGPRPFGVTFTGPAFSEALLIRAGAALEKALNGRVSPSDAA
jgi:amidase